MGNQLPLPLSIDDQLANPSSLTGWEGLWNQRRARLVALPTTRGDLMALRRDWESMKASDPSKLLDPPFVVCCRECLCQIALTNEPDPPDRQYYCGTYWRYPYPGNRWGTGCYRFYYRQRDVDSGQADLSALLTVFPPDGMEIGAYPRVCKFVRVPAVPCSYTATEPMTDRETVEYYRRILRERRAEVLSGRWKRS